MFITDSQNNQATAKHGKCWITFCFCIQKMLASLSHKSKYKYMNTFVLIFYSTLVTVLLFLGFPCLIAMTPIPLIRFFWYHQDYSACVKASEHQMWFKKDVRVILAFISLCMQSSFSNGLIYCDGAEMATSFSCAGKRNVALQRYLLRGKSITAYRSATFPLRIHKSLLRGGRKSLGVKLDSRDEMDGVKGKGFVMGGWEGGKEIAWVSVTIKKIGWSPWTRLCAVNLVVNTEGNATQQME